MELLRDETWSWKWLIGWAHLQPFFLISTISLFFDHLESKEEELTEEGRSPVQVLLSIFAEENFSRITEATGEQLISMISN